MHEGEKHKSKLYCEIQSAGELFFSLVDYRNNLFTSNDPEKIIEFYDGFDNRDQLIRWMKERPWGRSKIIEVEGDSDIIVVIPTADFNGQYARNCREEIFKGLHIIFIESGNFHDPYFNYAHNCNIGIKRAMEYNPRWVILSNDDMYKIDDISILKNQLIQIDEKYTDIIYTKESEYHSKTTYIAKSTILRDLLLNFYGYVNRNRYKLEKKFKIIYIPHSGSDVKKLLFHDIRRFTLSGSITFLSCRLIQELNYKIFDETYINDVEDVDFALSIDDKKIKKAEIDFKIGDIEAGTLGNTNRPLRSIINFAYLNNKINNGILKAVKYQYLEN